MGSQASRPRKLGDSLGTLDGLDEMDVATALPRVRSVSAAGATKWPVAVSIEEFSYELTAAALAEQERALTALRTRAGTVLAAASIAGSFLGAKASHGSLDVWSILALLAFVGCVGTTIYVLLPHEFAFAFRGQALLATTDHEGIDDVVEAYRAVGIWIGPLLESNRDKIADLSDWFSVGCGLLAVEVILWTVSLAG
jgi:hypothetical protein